MELNVEKLEAFREAFGEDGRAFAKRIGLSHTAYYYYRNKERQPELKTVAKIAKNLDINPKELLTDDY